MMARMRYLLGALLFTGASAAQAYVEEARALRVRAAFYEHGRGVRQDYAEAYRLYCRAALLGDSLAAYSLGWMYFNGRGLAKRPGVAVGWFRRAARTGDLYAARMLRHYEGITAEEDPGCRPDPPPPVRQASVRPNKPSSPERRLVEDWVGRIAPGYAVDPELVMAVIEAESGFRSAALSSKNAQGLMQLIPATAERFGVKDTWDPEENIKGGTAYLNWLLRHFEGKVEWVLAAYNAGERTVEQYQGVPPFPETRNYVKKILDNYQKTVHPIPPPLSDHS